MSWEESINRGTLALARSDYATAETAFKNALETAQVNFAEGDERLSKTRSFLGQTYYKLGDHLQAQNYLKLSTSSCEQSDQNVLRLAVDYLSLAQMNYINGHASDAHEHFGKAMRALTAKSLAPDRSFSSTAGLEKILRNVKKREAEKTNAGFRILLMQARKNHQPQPKSQEYFGTEPDAIVDAWQNLIETGVALTQKSDHEALTSAFQNLNSAVRISQSIFPPNHPNIADSITALANVAAKLELCDDAIALYKEALRISALNETTSSKQVVLKLSAANFYSGQFDYQTAIEFVTDALEQSESLSGDEHLEISATLFDLMQKADIYRTAREMIKNGIECEERDHLEQANFYFDNSLALLEKTFGSTHLEVAQILMFKANVLRKLNDKSKAEEAQRRVSEIESELMDRALKLDQLKANLPAIRLNK